VPHFALSMLAVTACIISFSGCSSNGPGDVRLRSLTAEPELPAATTSADLRVPLVAGVPEVICPPRAFRVADFLADRDGARAHRPATLAATLPAVPREPGWVGDGFVRPVAAVESSREPATLPSVEPATTAEAAPLVAEIRDMLHRYVRAFNHHDAAAVAAHWTADGESRNLDSGEVTAGREAVRAVFSDLFETDDQGTLGIDVSSIRPVRADVAIVDGLAQVGSSSGLGVMNRFSAVVVQEEGQWLFQSIREAAAQAVTSPVRPLDELAWLVGFWEDDGDGVTAGTQCDWTSGKGFLMRSHVISPDSASAQLPRAGDERVPGLLPVEPAAAGELTEIIGWDSEREAIRSWIFTADGRFAEGTWERDGAGWVVVIEGRGADAGRQARCTLLPDGPNGLVMQCAGERLEGLVPPTCSFTRTAW
jgi:uncharacterized protein (TIGR02246 family)